MLCVCIHLYMYIVLGFKNSRNASNKKKMNSGSCIKNWSVSLGRHIVSALFIITICYFCLISALDEGDIALLKTYVSYNIKCIPVQTFWEKKFNMQDIGPAPNNFLQDLLKLCMTGIYKILKFKQNRWWEQ
jgi:hypothetical protein